MFWHGLAFLQERDTCSAVRLVVAIQNGQVHQLIAEDVGDDCGERLSAVDMGKAPVTGKAGRREQHNAADSRGDFGHRSFVVRFRDAEQTPAEEMICQERVQATGVATLCRTERHTHVDEN